MDVVVHGTEENHIFSRLLGNDIKNICAHYDNHDNGLR